MTFKVLKSGHYETFMPHNAYVLVKIRDEVQPEAWRMAIAIDYDIPGLWWDRELIRGLIEFEGLLIRSID